MYNKEMFKKICNVTCSFAELESFVIDMSKKEFDLDNPFEKYYDVQTILHAIHRYEKGEVTDRYLAYWMNAYDWIIMGGFKLEAKDNSITFKKWLEWEITDWLDSLSFFDETEELFELEDYKNAFAVLDRIYQNRGDWDRVFAHTDEWGDNDDDVLVLAYNSKSNEFVKLYAHLDYLQLDVKIPIVEFDEIEKKIEKLQEKGYRKLKYGNWDEKEIREV